MKIQKSIRPSGYGAKNWRPEGLFRIFSKLPYDSKFLHVEHPQYKICTSIRFLTWKWQNKDETSREIKLVAKRKEVYIDHRFKRVIKERVGIVLGGWERFALSEQDNNFFVKKWHKRLACEIFFLKIFFCFAGFLPTALFIHPLRSNMGSNKKIGYLFIFFRKLRIWHRDLNSPENVKWTWLIRQRLIASLNIEQKGEIRHLYKLLLEKIFLFVTFFNPRVAKNSQLT